MATYFYKDYFNSSHNKKIFEFNNMIFYTVYDLNSSLINVFKDYFKIKFGKNKYLDERVDLWLPCIKKPFGYFI